MEETRILRVELHGVEGVFTKVVGQRIQRVKEKRIKFSTFFVTTFGGWRVGRAFNHRLISFDVPDVFLCNFCSAAAATTFVSIVSSGCTSRPVCRVGCDGMGR